MPRQPRAGATRRHNRWQLSFLPRCARILLPILLLRCPSVPQFSNLRALLQSVTLNGLPMQRTDYGYWVIDTPGKNIALRPPCERCRRVGLPGVDRWAWHAHGLVALPLASGRT